MDVEFRLRWQNRVATHVERRFCTGVAPALDTMGGASLTPLGDAAVGTTVTLFPAQRLAQTDFRPPLTIARTDWPERATGHAIPPRLGRFHPARLLAGHPGLGLGTAAAAVVRGACLDQERGSVDLNHPLAHIPAPSRQRCSHTRMGDGARCARSGRRQVHPFTPWSDPLYAVWGSRL